MEYIQIRKEVKIEYMGIIPLLMKISGNERRTKRKRENQLQDACLKLKKKYEVESYEELSKVIETGALEQLYETTSMTYEDALAYYKKEQEEIERAYQQMLTRRGKSLKKVVIGNDHEKKEMTEALKAYKIFPNLERTGKTEYESITAAYENLYNQVTEDVARLQKGENGERRIKDQLGIFQEKYIFLENIVISAKDCMGNTSEADLYIVTDKGLIVAEIKNRGNTNQCIHIAKDGRWTLENAYNRKILSIMEPTPTQQNARHCEAAERLLRNKLSFASEIPIYSVIFIGNNLVTVQNESDATVIRGSEFYTYISNIKTETRLSQEQQNAIAQVLKEAHIGANDFPVTKRVGALSQLAKQEQQLIRHIEYDHELPAIYKKVKKDNPVKGKGICFLISLLVYPAIWLIGAPLTVRFRILLTIVYTGMLGTIIGGILLGILLLISGYRKPKSGSKVIGFV